MTESSRQTNSRTPSRGSADFTESPRQSHTSDNRRGWHFADVAPHRFAVGEVVRLTSRIGDWLKTDEVYRITGTLPARDNSLQYRIRSDNERYERVAIEDSLELVRTEPIIVETPVVAPPPAAPAKPVRRRKPRAKTSPKPKQKKAAAKPARVRRAVKAKPKKAAPVKSRRMAAKAKPATRRKTPARKARR
jgi:hypothetical protein